MEDESLETVLATDGVLLYVFPFLFHVKDSEGNPGDYQWLTYNEVWERVQDFGSGLLGLNLVTESYGVRFDCNYHG